MRYTFNIEKWISQNIANSKRLPKNLKILKVLLSPISTVHAAFVQVRLDILFKVSYSCQQGSLTALLNRKFAQPDSLKVFRIETIDDLRKKYFFPDSDEVSIIYPPVYVGKGSEPTVNPMYIGSGKEYDDSTSFVLYVPIELQAKENEIRAWVNYYRFVSKNFKII